VESQSDYHVKTYGSLLSTTPFEGINYMTVAPEPSIIHRTTTHHNRHTTHRGNVKTEMEVSTKDKK
jgi:hypothetical protein